MWYPGGVERMKGKGYTQGRKTGPRSVDRRYYCGLFCKFFSLSTTAFRRSVHFVALQPTRCRGLHWPQYGFYYWYPYHLSLRRSHLNGLNLTLCFKCVDLLKLHITLPVFWLSSTCTRWFTGMWSMNTSVHIEIFVKEDGPLKLLFSQLLIGVIDSWNGRTGISIATETLTA